MKAGQTNIEVGTKVILNIPNDKELHGLSGIVTHPFAFGCTDKGWVGIRLDGTNPDELPYGGVLNVRISELCLL